MTALGSECPANMRTTQAVIRARGGGRPRVQGKLRKTSESHPLSGPRQTLRHHEAPALATLRDALGMYIHLSYMTVRRTPSFFSSSFPMSLPPPTKITNHLLLVY